MKARHSYPLLFLLPSAMLAAGVLVFVAAAGAGVLWIYVYGDNEWPASARSALMWLASICAASSFLALIAASYRFGKAREASGGVSRSHMRWALGLSLGLPLLALLHQWQVGNLGNSSMPPNSSSKPTPLRGAA
jgi:hypothetical protein